MLTAPVIATLGSHSALQILKGAKDEGFKTLLVTLEERKAFYAPYPFIDRIITIPSYRDFKKLEEQLIKTGALLIPHGSFVAYLGVEGNKSLKVPYFGEKKVLDWEADRDKQKTWMGNADIKTPKHFISPDEVDRAVIVKHFGARGGEGYILAKDKENLKLKIKDLERGTFIIQEYIIGVPVFIHYFHSPLTGEIEIMSADRRYETNVDGLGRLPLAFQETLNTDPSYTVIGNFPITIRESLLPEVLDMGRRVVETSKKLIGGKGLFGPFCLEAIITPDQKIYVIEISARIVAGTNLFINGSPYTDLRYDKPVSTGRRTAIEIKKAKDYGRLEEVIT